MKHLLVTLSLTALSAAAAVAQTFSVTPGQLAAERQVPAEAQTITVTGTVDASDLAYLVEAVDHVRTLDLSGADIAPYKGTTVGFNTRTSPADVLPDYIMAGLKAERLLLPASLRSIGKGALMDSRIVEVILPAGLTSIGADAFAQCKSLAAIELPQGVGELSERTFEGCEALASATLPAALTTIGKRAFLGCGALQQVEIPATLASIGDEAFALSGLSAATLGACTGLTRIGNRAFASCTHLESAQLPSGATALGEGIFFDCAALTSVTLPAEAVALPALTLKGAALLTDVILPESTASIGALALAGLSGVQSISLPGSLATIGDGAFEGWTSVSEIDAEALTSVPELGRDVWAGVNQPEVTLAVVTDLEDAFRAAPQWQDFAIGRSHITLVPDVATDSGMLEAYFEGMMLRLDSTHPLASVSLYGVDGRLLTETDIHGDTGITLDTSRHAGAFFIVRATFVDDVCRAVVIKLLRPLNQ